MNQNIDIFKYIDQKEYAVCSRRAHGIASRVKKQLIKAYFPQGNSTFVCYSCDNKTDELTLDHVIPVCKGGITHRVNSSLCCRKCNCKKQSDLPSNEEILTVMERTLQAIEDCKIRMVQHPKDFVNCQNELKKLYFFARLLEKNFF